MSATKPVLQAAILQYAKQLRLPTVGDQFARLADEAVKEKQSHLSYLEALLEAEVDGRDRRAIARRIQEARFPAVKTLEEFDFQVVPHISVAVVRNLSEGGYLARKEPVIFLGETGREDALGNRVGGGRLPAAQASEVYDGGGNGDRADRSQEPVGANARAESLE
jgi:hypothetical protein